MTNVVSIPAKGPTENDKKAAEFMRELADALDQGALEMLCVGYMIDGTIYNFSHTGSRIELLGMLEYLKANIATQD